MLRGCFDFSILFFIRAGSEAEKDCDLAAAFVHSLVAWGVITPMLLPYLNLVGGEGVFHTFNSAPEKQRTAPALDRDIYKQLRTDIYT